LHIGGGCVARGYLNRPGLTAQRFIPDPFTPGQRLYKTGDLVRRRPDGSIVFLGRADDQVEIRGLRIELGEVEAALAAHPAVAQAVVTVVPGPAGEKQLAAYLRLQPGSADVGAHELRHHCERTLPPYMIPAHLITVSQFPLNASGKVSRTALPAPETQPPAGHVPPATLIETMIADLYAEVLELEQVGATDSFFDLGGNSLLSMRLVSLLDSELGVDVGVAEVFLAPTPRQFAALLRGKHGMDDAELGGDGIESLEPLTRDM
jgi:acyl carrier protein